MPACADHLRGDVRGVGRSPPGPGRDVAEEHLLGDLTAEGDPDQRRAARARRAGVDVVAVAVREQAERGARA